MKRVLISIAAVVLGVGVLTAGAGNAGAGPLNATQGDFLTVDVAINYWVSSRDGDAATIADGLTGELFLDSGTDVTNLCSTVPTTLPQSRVTLDCTVPPDDYQVGVSGIPDGYFVQGVGCGGVVNQEVIDQQGAEFSAVVEPVVCNVDIGPIPRLYVDKVVTGGDAVSSDFTIEVFGTAGNLVTTVVDPADVTCSTLVVDDADCGAVQLLPGDYVLGEEFVSGYYATNASCVPYFDAGSREEFDFPSAEFAHAVRGTDTLCTVDNVYVTRTVLADIVVENDSGGTATGADFTIEVYDSEGTLVDSGVDPEPGIGNASAEFTLPIDNYQFGVSGPDGYTATVAVTVEVIEDELIDDPSAQFTLDIDNSASGVITVNDPTTTTTTITTTTLAPTTTQAPTTTIDQGILPATGSDQSPTLALLAIGLLLFGGGAVYLSRRR